ncbi:hypothetical protein ACXZ65_09010 [Streptomyces aculeolatus]
MTTETGDGRVASAPAARPRSLPAPGFADVRIVAAGPEAARRIAEVLRLSFAADEQRSYPAGEDGQGTRLHLTIDTVHAPEAVGPSRLLVTHHPHDDELWSSFRRTLRNMADVPFVVFGRPLPAAATGIVPESG